MNVIIAGFKHILMPSLTSIILLYSYTGLPMQCDLFTPNQSKLETD